MQKEFNYLYKIINLINGKFYYGIHSTDNLDDGYMGSGTCLHEAYKKYGIENFQKEILEFRNTREEISDLEKEIVTEELVKNPDCYNIRLGGDEGTTLGTATMKDKDGNIKRVVIGSDEYNNMVGITKGFINVYDKIEQIYKQVSKKDFYNNKKRYCGITKNYVTVYDKIENKNKKILINDFYNDINRYIGVTLGKVVVLMDGKYKQISHEEYLKGNYQTVWSGKHLSEKTKQKISQHHKETGLQKGEKNSQFGTCWITKDGENKKIKKEELDIYLNDGWIKGKFCEKPIVGKIDINIIKKYIKDGLTYLEISKKCNINLTTLKHFINDNNCIMTCWVHNNNQCIKIQNIDLDKY